MSNVIIEDVSILKESHPKRLLIEVIMSKNKNEKKISRVLHSRSKLIGLSIVDGFFIKPKPCIIE